MNKKTFNKFLLDSMDGIIRNELSFKVRKRIYYSYIDELFYIRIGLNTTSYLDINPVIGVGSVQVIDIENKIYNEKTMIYEGTVVKHLGYTTNNNKYTPLEFLDIYSEHINDDMLKTLCEKEFNRFRQEYSTYGKRFIEKNSNLEGMKKSFEEEENFLYRERRLPIIYFLLGEPNKAIDFLRKEMKRRESEKAYIEYATKLMALILDQTA